MAIRDLNDLSGIITRDELRRALAESGDRIGLPQLRRLVNHAESLEPPIQPLRLGVVHTYTSELLDPWLSLAAAVNGLQAHTYHGPYGFLFQEANDSSGLVQHRPDITVLLLQRSDLHPALAGPLSVFDLEQQRTLLGEALDRLRSIVGAFREYEVGQIVVTVLPPMFRPGLGVYDAQSDRSESAWWARVKAEVGRYLREDVPACLFLDLDCLLAQVGRNHFFDLRLWYSSMYPFSATAAREVASAIARIGAVIKLPKAKVIVLDADNTLWGGVIGEDGTNGIALGPDYPGNAYREFQRRLLEYRQRGFILAMCSKNNPQDVDEILRDHPHQLLKEHHFAARRVNWQSKPDNLVSLAAELNLGLESFIVIDDSEYECAAIRHQLPQVEVVRTPDKPLMVPGCLEHVGRLETLSVTAEDTAKTHMYVQERERRVLKQALERDGSDLGTYLRSLHMTMRLGLNDVTHAKRLAQLTQKTNQFNLTTRRYDEQKIQSYIHSADWLVAHFALRDIFGDSGVVGLALFHKVGSHVVELDTFLMSCRVIGRDAEGAFLHCLLRLLAEQGAKEVIAEYIPSAKNSLAAGFLREQQFARQEDGRYRFDLGKQRPKAESDFPVSIDTSLAEAG